MVMEQEVLDHNNLLDGLESTPSPEAMLARHDYEEMAAQELCWALGAAELKGAGDIDAIEAELAQRTISYISSLDDEESTRLINELNNYIDGYKNTHASFDEIKQMFQEDIDRADAYLKTWSPIFASHAIPETSDEDTWNMLNDPKNDGDTIADDDFTTEASQPPAADAELLGFMSPDVARKGRSSSNNNKNWLTARERALKARDETILISSDDEEPKGWLATPGVQERVVVTYEEDQDDEDAIEAILTDSDDEEEPKRTASRWKRFSKSVRERYKDLRHGEIDLALNGREMMYNFPEHTTMQKLGEKAVYGFLVFGTYGVWHYKDALK